MARSDKLKLVARYEELLQQRQLSRMLSARQQLEKQQALTARLQDYLADYASINQPGSPATRPSDLQNASHFVQELEQALGSQRQIELGAETDYQQQRDSWLNLHARGRAIDKLIDKASGEEQRAAALQEDREAEDQWGVHQRHGI